MACTVLLVGSSVLLIGVVAFIAAKILLLKKAELAKPEVTVPATTTVGLPLRKPLLFCTVGYNFEEAEDLKKKMPCDYLIYSDVIANNKTFVPLYGPRSWSAFKTVLGEAPSSVTGGLSFSLSEGIGPDSTFDIINKQQAALQAFIRLRMIAMGTFDYEPTAGVPISSLKSFFKFLNKTLPRSPNSMVFLGVFLATNIIADAFIADVSKITEISTLIVETHITLREAHLGGHTDCHAYPISAVGIKNLANNTVPRLEVAEHAVNVSRSRGDLFRMVFSSTMGVMVYKQIQNKPISRFRDQCSTWNMGDYDVTCDPDLNKQLEESDMASFAIVNSGQYLFSFEDDKSLKRKLERYLPASSDGWCLFDVHRDVYWTCGINIPPSVQPNQAIDISNSPQPMLRAEKVKALMSTIKRGNQ
ncbi:uncharacterized protein LOC119401011 [Rhipicephalus sanguineus]|uniref:uncharacterized protein LOC119401011 n=1 Tax=Rhipicephalus sanguineus TaxID=34632 RepID=UPI0020C2585C|nr:uncharacterized protein LOC119401011 [Rhipicephalus sanguineus]